MTLSSRCEMFGREALVVGLEDRAGRGRRDGDAGELERRATGDGEIQRGFLGQLQIHIVLLGLGAAVARYLDVERTADAQTLRRVAAFRIGDDRARRVRRHVHDLDPGACDGLPVRIDDATAQRGRRVLRKRARHHAQRTDDPRQQSHTQLACSCPNLFDGFLAIKNAPRARSRIARDVRFRRSIEPRKTRRSPLGPRATPARFNLSLTASGDEFVTPDAGNGFQDTTIIHAARAV